MENQVLLEKAVQIAIRAGEIILNIYESGDYNTQLKRDKTPVTIADKLADTYIVDALSETNIPTISEEAEVPSFETRRKWTQFWLIDPIDGTKEFLNKNGEFTVNIALIQNGTPTLGVVYAPVLGCIYYGCVGNGAYRAKIVSGQLLTIQKLPVEQRSLEKITVVASRSHKDKATEQFMQSINEDIEILSKGSSLKFCMIATGEAMLYPRFIHLKEWDIAAGVALVLAAGGEVRCAANATPLTFNSRNLETDFFVAKSRDFITES